MNGARCRRCGGDAGEDAFVHYFWLVEEDGAREIELHVCRPCGREFADRRARDEYVRAVLLG
jgi:ribosomal protein S14